MSPPHDQSAFRELRRRAEETAKRLGASRSPAEASDVASLLEELTVHQIELEMQAQELAQTADELSRAKALYFRYFEAAPLPVVRFTEDGSVIEMNLAASEMLGAHRSELAGGRRDFFRRRLSPMDDALLKRTIRSCLGSDKARQIDLALPSADGTTRIFDVTILGLSDTNNAIAFFADETDARHAAAENQRLAMVARYTTNAVLFTDPQRRIVWVNDAFLRISGYSFEEIRGRKPSLLQGPDTDVATIHRMRAALAREEGFTEEILNYSKEGQAYWIHLEVMPWRDESGRLMGFISLQSDITERRARAEELQNLRTAVDQSASSIVVTDRRGHIQFVNPAFERATGYTAAEAIGQNPSLLKSGEQSKEFYDEMWHTLLAGRVWTGTFRNRRKDGSLYWEAASISPVFDENGEIARFIAVKDDITTQVESEQARLREHKKLDMVLRAASEVGIIATDKNGVITVFNAGAERLLGYSAAEAIDHLTPLVWHDEVEIQNRAQELERELGTPVQGFDVFTAVPSSAASEEREWTLVRKDGRRVAASVVVTAVREDDGETAGYVGIVVDITKRKQAERALAASEDLLERTGRVAGIGGWEVDFRTMKPRWTTQTRRIHEVSDDYEVQFESALAFYPKGARELVEQAVAHTMQTGDAFGLEVPFITAKGRRIIVHVRGELDVANGEKRLVGTLQDITQRKASEDALADANLRLRDAMRKAEAASEAKSQFLANMSHEIRTPLNAIIGMSELLESAASDLERREYVDTIRTSGDTLLALINDILDFSKIEAGQLQLERIPVDLHACISSAMHIISVAAAKKSLILQTHIAEDVPRAILGDPTRLRQVLVNLLSNAVKFTDNGTITADVGVGRKSGSLRFCVKDTGIGIGDDQVEKLFHTFSQLDASTTRRYGGTGLGLAISKRLVEMMGGSIWVESAPGKGSIFAFEIPATPANPPRAAHEVTATLGAGEPLAVRNPLSILVAEDNIVNQRLALLILRRLGYEPEVVSNGLEVLEALKHKAYDLVLLDLQMPEMDGLTAAREICRGRNREERPVLIALTANALEADREICLAAGMDAHLGKPIRVEQLASELRRAYERRHRIHTS